MAILCPRCGAALDVTLFAFGRCVACDCGCWVDLQSGHTEQLVSLKKGAFAMAEVPVGRVTHYFSHLGVAAIEITHGTLAVGDTIHIKGHTSDFYQPVTSMQIEHQTVTQAQAGQSIGLKVVEHAREHDLVYKVVPEE